MYKYLKIVVCCILIFAGVIFLFRDKLLDADVVSYNTARLHFEDQADPNGAIKALAAIEKAFLNGYEPAITTICLQVKPTSNATELAACQADFIDNKHRQWQALGKLANSVRDFENSARYFQQAVDAGNPFSHFEKLFLEAQFKATNLKDIGVLESMYSGAQMGDPRAQYMLAAAQIAAKGNPEFDLSTWTIDQLAAMKSVPSVGDGYFRLAELMKAGKVSSDLSYEDVLQRADRYGNKNASLLLIELYSKAVNISDQGKKITFWTEKAAGYGYAQAQYNIATKLVQDSGADNLKEAIKWLDLASQQGLAEAQTALGVMLYYGNDALSKDRITALQYLEAAAEKNNPEAYFNLGAINYAEAGSLTPNAIHYLRKSAELGNTEAQLLLNQSKE